MQLPQPDDDEPSPCPRCGADAALWTDYFCPRCGTLNEDLYRAEHVAPHCTRTMDRRAIVGEYSAAQMPFGHQPHYKRTGHSVLQPIIMQDIRRSKRQ